VSCQLSLFPRTNRILIASPRPGVVQTYKPVFESRGYEVWTTTDGFNAIKLLEAEKNTRAVKTDVILLDIMLPSWTALLVNLSLNHCFHIPCLPVASCPFCDSVNDPEQVLATVNEVLHLVEEGVFWTRYEDPPWHTWGRPIKGLMRSLPIV